MCHVYVVYKRYFIEIYVQCMCNVHVCVNLTQLNKSKNPISTHVFCAFVE